MILRVYGGISVEQNDCFLGREFEYRIGLGYCRFFHQKSVLHLGYFLDKNIQFLERLHN